MTAVRSMALVLLLLIRCWVLLPLWDSVIVLCFAVRYFVSIQVLQSSRWGRESWLLCFICLPGVSWLLCRSSLRCHGFVCSLWLWYFLIILTHNFWFIEHTKYIAYAQFHVMYDHGRIQRGVGAVPLQKSQVGLGFLEILVRTSPPWRVKWTTWDPLSPWV